jgi:hypothetical protein
MSGEVYSCCSEIPNVVRELYSLFRSSERSEKSFCQQNPEVNILNSQPKAAALESKCMPIGSLTRKERGSGFQKSYTGTGTD